MKATKRGNKLSINLVRKSIFARFWSWLVRLVITKGWAGHSEIDGRFMQTWAGAMNKETSPAKRELIKLARKQRQIVKKHFVGGPAYPLDLDLIRNDIIADYFGFQVSDILSAELVKGLPVDEHIRIDGPVLVKRGSK